MEEIFKTIEGYENYEISNLGNVRNKKTNRIMKKRNSFGYYGITLSKNNKRFHTFIHRLIATAFIENPENKELIDHIDNDRLNNDINNLRWSSYIENNRNKPLQKNNKSGHKGIYFNKKNNKWHVRIDVNKKKIHLGYFVNIEDAVEARCKASKELFGEFINECENA